MTASDAPARCICCGQFVPQVPVAGPRCEHCGQLAPCLCGGRPEMVRHVIQATALAFVHGAMLEEEALARFEASGREDLAALARQEIASQDLALAADTQPEPSGVEAQAESAAAAATLRLEITDVAREMLRRAAL